MTAVKPIDTAAVRKMRALRRTNGARLATRRPGKAPRLRKIPILKPRGNRGRGGTQRPDEHSFVAGVCEMMTARRGIPRSFSEKTSGYECGSEGFELHQRSNCGCSHVRSLCSWTRTTRKHLQQVSRSRAAIAWAHGRTGSAGANRLQRCSHPRRVSHGPTGGGRRCGGAQSR